MAYAQTNYQQKQGMTVNGRAPYYTIAQIGCFITSFCNLLERFGTAIDPPAMDNAIAARRAYIDVDDGIFDDVGWGTISAIDGNVVVNGTGTGNPPHNNCIVKFIYGGNKTHFSLVADARAGLIIDSWDGKVKHWDTYGGVKAWASYINNKPQPVTPVQGVEMIANEDQARDAYALLRGSRDALSVDELNSTAGRRSWAGFAVDARNEINAREAYKKSLEAGIGDRDRIISELRTALANEQSKPPKEVIKEVEKIVEKPIEVVKEVPIEVIKEVPVDRPFEVIKEVVKPATWQSVIDFLREQINAFLKKGQ